MLTNAQKHQLLVQLKEDRDGAHENYQADKIQ